MAQTMCDKDLPAPRSVNAVDRVHCYTVQECCIETVYPEPFESIDWYSKYYH